MNILYLHGLDGKLSGDKKRILLNMGEVIAPDIDYRGNSDIIEFLADKYQSHQVDIIIGSSMGGFAAYYLSLLLTTPCLLFNPALPYRSVPQSIPALLPKRTNYIQLVLGNQDETIKAADTIDFLKPALNSELNINIHLINRLGHRIPVYIFEAEISAFTIYNLKNIK